MMRADCNGGCRRLVLVKQGAECRKCRRKRTHAGAKRLFKLRRAERAASRS